MVNIQSPNKIMLEAKKKKNIKIYLDLDGVLSDWLGGACSLCGIDLKDEEIRSKLKKENCFLSNFMGEKELWNNIEKAGVGFWEDLDLFPWSKKLYKTLENISGEFSILSSPGKYTEIAGLACHGKVLWLDKHFGNKENYLFGYKKFLCAGKDVILIDDSKNKIDPFIENGGNGFLWPTSLSLLDGDVDVDETIKELVDYIEKL